MADERGSDSAPPADPALRPLPLSPPRTPKLSTPGLIRLELSRVYRCARAGQISWQTGCQAAHILTSLHRMLADDTLAALATRIEALEAAAMISGNRRASLEGRVQGIERRLADILPTTAGPLSRIERAELADVGGRTRRTVRGTDRRHGLARAARFLAWHSGDGGGSAQRLDDLRRRNSGPAVLAEQRAMPVAIDAMG